MNKAIYKYVAMKLHHFGINMHGFWNGDQWVMHEIAAILYEKNIDAKITSDKHGGAGQFVKYAIYESPQ